MEDSQITNPANCPRLTKEMSISVLKTFLETRNTAMRDGKVCASLYDHEMVLQPATYCV